MTQSSAMCRFERPDKETPLVREVPVHADIGLGL